MPVPPDDTLQPVRTGVQGGLGQTGQEGLHDGNMILVNISRSGSGCFVLNLDLDYKIWPDLDPVFKISKAYTRMNCALNSFLFFFVIRLITIKIDF